MRNMNVMMTSHRSRVSGNDNQLFHIKHNAETDDDEDVSCLSLNLHIVDSFLMTSHGEVLKTESRKI